VSADCVLATNTSSLSIAEMASGLAHPERVVGFHFFNPVAVMPLLEIARSAATDESTYATAFAVGAALKKTCVAVRDAPAFIVNRLLWRLFGEILRALDEGTPFDVADAALEPLGLPMTPLTLIGFTGPAVTLHVAESMHAAFPDRFFVSENLRRLVDEGKRGIYVGGPGSREVDPDVAKIYGAHADGIGADADEVRRRALSAVADEAFRILDEQVVRDASEIDLCMLTGAGFPLHLGGLTPYLDREGVSEVVNGRRFHARGVASLS
jgi:3-hydroxyacyl-CoA dehydrogenase